MELETRHFNEAELRAESVDVNGQPQRRIIGFGAMYNTRSNDLGGFIEIVKPGSMAHVFAAGADLRALINHDPSQLLGRQKSGTLQISDLARGPQLTIVPPDTQAARDVMTLIDRGDIDGMSFGFRTIKDSWRKEDGQIVRELHEVKLSEYSVVTFPAYQKTTVSVRSLEKAKELVNTTMIVVPIELAKAKLKFAEREV